MKPTKAHSPIGASSMYRWAACPGSVRLSEGIKSVASVYAAEGTVAHSLAAVCATLELPATHYLGQKRTSDGHEFVIDEEMCAAVQVYLDAGTEGTAPDDVVLLEHKFDLSSIHPGLFGTCDRVIWKPKQQILIVDDYKHGAGIPVEVKGNPQLRYYGLGALITLKYPAKEVWNRIIQPRCHHVDGPVRVEKLAALDMLDFQADLIAYAQKTEDPNASLHAGDHCRFCPAAPVCPEIRRTAETAAALAFGPDAPGEPSALAEALLLAPIVEAWAKSVREHCYAQAEAGISIPGFKLVEKRATRKWRDVPAAELALKAVGLGETQMYPLPELKSPAQIDDVLKELKFKPAERAGTLKPLVVKESSGHALAPESDKRPPVKQAAAEAFAGA